MNSRIRFFEGFGFVIFNVALAFILTLLLLPYGVPRISGADDVKPPEKTTIIETQTAIVTSNNETELSTSDKKIKITINAGTVDETMDFQLNKHLSPSSTGMRIINLFELNAKTQESDTFENTIHEFKKEMEITIQHTPQDLAGLDIDSLNLYYLNEETRQWELVPSKFDRETLTLTAKINHFSYFGEQANPLESGPGRVMAAQVGLSSGTATYSYPFELPPGPGGFTPSLTLNYNSGSVDGMKNKRDVGSWVGIGWSLKLGSISYSAESEKYNIDLNGVSYEIVTADDVNFHTRPEEYLKITKSGNTWTVYDKSGTEYRFGGTVDSEQYTDTSDYYRWDLSYWKDTNGNEATVSYVRDIFDNSVRSAYPEYLRYNNNLVEVHFLSSYHENGDDGPVRYDNPISYGSNPVPKIMENRQLDAIEIKVSSNLTRKYSFSYTTTDRVYSSDYDGIYYSGAHTLTSITQVGADGTSSLPAISFTYADKQVFRKTTETQYTGNPGNPASLTWPFLTEIDSGYGGDVSFTYTQIPDNSTYDYWTRQAVTGKTVNSGIGQTETYSYTYTGNPAYSGTGWDQEFYGWNEVTETDVAGNYIKHYFYTTGMINGKSADHFRGKEYSTKWYDYGNPTTPVKEINYDWIWETTEPYAEGFYLGAKTGGTIYDANELAVAPDGSVYVASLGTGRIVKYDSNLVYVPSPFDSISIPYPRGISVDNQGYIYVTCNTKDVRKYSSDGTLITEFSVVGMNVLYIYDIAVPPSGDIYVIGRCNYGADGFVLRYDSAGNLIGQYFFPYSNMQYWQYWYRVFDIEIATDGYIYITTLYVSAVVYQPVVNTDYLSKLPQDLSSITNTAFGSVVSEFGLGISESNNMYITSPDWTEVYNQSTGKRWGNQPDLVDVAVGENFIYTLSSGNAFKYSRTNWLVKLNKVEEITNGTKTTRTEYVYDDYGNVITEKRYGDISTSADDSTLHRVYYANNSTAYIVNKPARERVYATISEDVGGANLKKETLYYYDSSASYTTPPTIGNLTRIDQKKDASNSISSYMTYDSYGNLLTSQDPNSNTTTWTFDTTYHVYPLTKTVPLVGTEYYTYAPGTTNLLSMTDVNSQTTTYEYDTFGRLLKVIKPGDSSASPSVEYQYNNWGTTYYQNIKTITKVDASTFLWQTQYFDGLGRVIQVHANGESGHTIISSTTIFNNRGRVEKQYVSQDIASNLTSYQAPEASWKYSSSTYDALGRVVTQTGADNTSISHDYSTAWQDTVTNQRGYQTVYFYDAFQQLVEVEELNASYQLYATTTYTYDVLGNLLQVVDNDSNTTTLTYDWLSNKTSMNDPDMGSWSYTYDNNGNLITQTDAKSQTITMAYDALNRLIYKMYPVGANMTNVYYGYDSGTYGIGQRTSMTDASGNTTYTYDNRGRLIQENRVIDTVSYITSFTYDGVDRPVTVTYPTGEVVTQTYDGRGLPYSVSGTAAGNLVTGTLYNSLGSITEINLGNGLKTTYGYYGTGGAYDTTGGYYGKLWEIKTLPQGGGNALQDVRHTWDAGSNLITRTDVLTSTTENFEYDFLDRLLIAYSGNYSETYTYNQIGNILIKNGVNYTYGAKPHAVTQVGQMTYSYDANGNMITRLDQTLVWDVENRPVSVSSNSTAAVFIYDGDGNRVKKIENGETVLYVNQYYEKNLTTGNVTTSYYLGGRLVATKENDVLRYVHQDHLTGTSLMTDSAGNQIGETMKYLPFGETLTGSVPTDKKFTGQRLDETGLYYYGARYYDPTIGRFTKPDVVIQSPANPQSLNRYSYTMNNPLKYVDPSGNIVEIDGYDVSVVEAAMSYTGMNQEIASLIADVVASPLYQAYDKLSTVAPELTNYLEGAEEIIQVEFNSAITAAAQFNSTFGDEGSIYINTNLEGISSDRLASVIGHEAFHAAYWIGLDHDSSNSAANEAFAYSLQWHIGDALGIDVGWPANQFSDINPYIPSEDLRPRIDQAADQLYEMGYHRPFLIFWTKPLYSWPDAGMDAFLEVAQTVWIN